MNNAKIIKLALLLLSVFLLQGCLLKKSDKQPVKLDAVVSKVKIESVVSHQEAGWLRVSGNIKNTSEYPVTSVEVKLILTGDAEVFDARHLILSQGKRLEPGQTVTFDSTFDYGTKEIPKVTVDAAVVTLQVLE
ncbi:hypothetical protein [Desulforamulus putei]|uniref:Lipoprotein n=1 Tax=Desulforamulus putei DSM 12395 TaxID=1121429 RepID=A0A1M5AVX3_9FIRM|nr:hypothetical protein [Desulforamulus putei]SHF34296.1 hypothetical protein SAMN02745133_02395 [Desulforamulus putei DSM 12395]